jgi:methanogenic corrinoid protein MtbC1
MTKEDYLNKVDLNRPNASLREFAQMLSLKDAIIDTLEKTIQLLREKANEAELRAEEALEKNMP